MLDKALIEADRELSRLLQLGLGPFAIAEAYSVPVRRLGTDAQLEVDETYQSLPGYLKGTPGILTWDYLRSALADQIMEIWINERILNERSTRSSERSRTDNGRPGQETGAVSATVQGTGD